MLSQVAASRQVVVFTHDDRLAEAVRHLQLPATVWEVVRRERSVIELRKSEDPVTRYLDDARALAMTTELPERAKAVVVAGFCRCAIEAACHEKIRSSRLASGMPHAEVERALVDARTLTETAALALFDNAARGADVMPRLASYGRGIADGFKAANRGVHGAHAGGLTALVDDTKILTAKLRR